MNDDIVKYFISLIKIDSESKNEKKVAQKLALDLEQLGAITSFDNANDKTGGNIGNLYASFSGKPGKKPLFFCAHLDTVVPGKGIKPRIENNRIVSDGTTVLGSDDKSGIAQIIWAIKELQEEKFDYSPIEVLFTISEEIGLLGAKNCDYSRLQSEMGYALDSHVVGTLMSGGPSQNNVTIVINGKSSHAGVAPEKGVNAIKIAAEAITAMPSGRIDETTTCNIGIIKGGKATNIVPEQVIIEAEVRSHNNTQLNEITDKMINAATSVVNKYKEAGVDTSIIVKVAEEYKTFRIDPENEIIKIARKASEKLDLPFEATIGGGGSDANIFNENGMIVAVAGSGMNNVHTVNEFITLKDLRDGADWVKEVIKIYSV